MNASEARIAVRESEEAVRRTETSRAKLRSLYEAAVKQTHDRMLYNGCDCVWGRDNGFNTAVEHTRLVMEAVISGGFVIIAKDELASIVAERNRLWGMNTEQAAIHAEHGVNIQASEVINAVADPSPSLQDSEV